MLKFISSFLCIIIITCYPFNVFLEYPDKATKYMHLSITCIVQTWKSVSLKKEGKEKRRTRRRRKISVSHKTKLLKKIDINYHSNCDIGQLFTSFGYTPAAFIWKLQGSSAPLPTKEVCKVMAYYFLRNNIFEVHTQ